MLNFGRKVANVGNPYVLLHAKRIKMIVIKKDDKVGAMHLRFEDDEHSYEKLFDLLALMNLTIKKPIAFCVLQGAKNQEYTKTLTM